MVDRARLTEKTSSEASKRNRVKTDGPAEARRAGSVQQSEQQGGTKRVGKRQVGRGGMRGIRIKEVDINSEAQTTGSSTINMKNITKKGRERG